MPKKFGVFSNTSLDTDTDSDDEPVYEQVIVIELVINGQTKDLENWICDPRCDVNETDIYGNCGVIAAAARNDLEILKILFEAGANLDVSDHVGRSPMSYARKYHNESMIDFIEENRYMSRPSHTN